MATAGRSASRRTFVAAAATLTALTCVAGSLHPAGAALPGRNGRIAFVSDRNGTSKEVFTMDSAGRRVRQLTHIGLDGAYEPAFAPRGKRVAFVTNREGYKILTIGTDGKRQRPFPGHPNLTAEGLPYFSPGGRRIVYQSNRGPGADIEIFSARLNGKGRRQLTHNTFSDGDPAYSPDGRRIVFYSDRDGDEEIFVMRADGTRQTQLTHNAIRDGAPSFSPNGQRIVFDSRPDGSSPEIFVMRPNGTGQRQLTDTENSGAGNPDYSPNGKRIVFDSDRDGENEIFVMRADGTGERQLTHNTVTDEVPAWQPLPRRRHR
jgi:tol-pal system beta propeller repeat protein TolB